jgi:glycosyltransferase involved in cell wall biosynthesis
MLRLGCSFTYFCNGEGVSHTFLSVCRGLGAGIDARLIVPGCTPEYRASAVIEAVPGALNPLVYRSTRAARILTERRLLHELENFDAVYLFPAVSLAAVKHVHQKGTPIVLERVSCAQQVAKRILDDAYRRLDQPPAHHITPQGIAEESDEVRRADYLVCASPRAKKSFLEVGVPEEKLIESSYGWSPRRFGNIPPRKAQADLFTVLFVGRVCVGKGAQLLLQAWARAGIRGRLILCGDLEPAIAKNCGDLLGRKDVLHVPYTRQVSLLYQQADLFAIPSLVEGGPLVTYEAMAHGLPVLTSPMGAGAIVRDGLDGKILEPYDADGWVDALREYAQAATRREEHGRATRLRANEFTWDQVAVRRGDALLARVKGVAH